MIKLDFASIIAELDRFVFPDVDLVVGIAEGGVVPAALVAYKLAKPALFVRINYRDINNTPRYDSPLILRNICLDQDVKRILLVDDVAVTGKTLITARDMLLPKTVVTFVLKGKADLVLLPDIKECVDWPWKQLIRPREES